MKKLKQLKQVSACADCLQFLLQWYILQNLGIVAPSSKISSLETPFMTVQYDKCSALNNGEPAMALLGMNSNLVIACLCTGINCIELFLIKGTEGARAALQSACGDMGGYTETLADEAPAQANPQATPEGEALLAEERHEADARRFAEGHRKVAEEEEAATQRQKQTEEARIVQEAKERAAEAVAAQEAEEAATQRQKQIEEPRIVQEAKERAAEAVAAQEAEMKGKFDKLLKDYGVVEVNQKKKSFMSNKHPLHYAVEKGDTEAVRLLLHFKADASLLNSSKKTALQLAEKAKKKDETIISLLRAA